MRPSIGFLLICSFLFVGYPTSTICGENETPTFPVLPPSTASVNCKCKPEKAEIQSRLDTDEESQSPQDDEAKEIHIQILRPQENATKQHESQGSPPLRKFNSRKSSSRPFKAFTNPALGEQGQLKDRLQLGTDTGFFVGPRRKRRRRRNVAKISYVYATPLMSHGQDDAEHNNHVIPEPEVKPEVTETTTEKHHEIETRQNLNPYNYYYLHSPPPQFQRKNDFLPVTNHDEDSESSNPVFSWLLARYIDFEVNYSEHADFIRKVFFTFGIGVLIVLWILLGVATGFILTKGGDESSSGGMNKRSNNDLDRTLDLLTDRVLLTLDSEWLRTLEDKMKNKGGGNSYLRDLARCCITPQDETVDCEIVRKSAKSKEPIKCLTRLIYNIQFGEEED